ncbi:FAD/NAD(P)-binding protein [Winogradskyella psychrotolerans]|uniref:FAD/NAD(P)-binding protein n=1 Tax=Winogradskyella psychrotolerans TaxID=1344585 RepID=UPI001C073BC0|nr:FAD/NAD(P)-binding protein [Winogradskyella psychrotolerans]MBU2927167.1 FAD/NAD(P)-binding protein [Winogradskyella psychrotolerans]
MKELAIIGMGPRGLYALECLLIALSKDDKEIGITLFDITKSPGTSTVWSLLQPESNWINITERALSGIEGRPQITYGGCTIEAFPSYHEWCNFSQTITEADTFPPRRKVGDYLYQRYKSIEEALQVLTSFKFYQSTITALNLKNDSIEIISKDNQWTCDDVLLTIGHQPTESSEQLKTWQSHGASNTSISLFNTAYPIDQLKEIKNQQAINIGIRGFGLAMIDVMRYLTITDFGNFKVINPETFETIYYKVKEQHLKLVPFSLDGLPLVPKPLNARIDHWYQPTSEELEWFKSEIENGAQHTTKTDSIDFLTHAIARIASRVFKDLKTKAVSNVLNKDELHKVILNWLEDENYTHDLIQDQTISTYKLIKDYIEMALGTIPVSLDFCIGQVWRHCQPTLYKAFSHAKVDDAIIEQVIALDERSKRYSYGPPIESMQQVLALVDADVLTLDFVNDPDIGLTDEGWNFTNANKESITCSTMINSVLDAPKLLEVTSPLIKNLLQNDLIQPIHSKLGIETTADGYVITPDDKIDVPIAVLGRLAKGSVIGVDAILECFGPRIEDWAKAYVERLKVN